MHNVMESRPRKPHAWTDVSRGHFAIQIDAHVPTRVHATNGSYLFSVSVDDSGRAIVFLDASVTDHPKVGNYRVIDWENPLGGNVQEAK